MVQKDGQNLIFIMALPRSGTTLLSAILGTHSEISCPPEPWFLLRLKEVTGTPSFMKSYDDYFARVGTVSFIKEDSFPECARAFAVCAYNNHLKNANRKIMVDKTPRYYHILDFIETLFPKAIKIWLKRDPLDVMASYKTSWEIGSDILTAKKIDAASFDFIVGLHSLEKYFSEKTPFKYSLKYEDLAGTPDETIRKLCSFCSLRFEDSMMNYGANTKLMADLQGSELGDKQIMSHEKAHGQSVGRWQKVLSKEEVEALVGIIGTNIFMTMGYDESVRVIREEFRITNNPTTEELENIREQLFSDYSSGIHFHWEHTALRKLLCGNKEFLESLLPAQVLPERDTLLEERDAPIAECNTLAADRDSRVAEIATLASERDSLRLERDALAAHRDSLVESREEILHSLSWRLTTPLRYIGKFFVRR